MSKRLRVNSGKDSIHPIIPKKNGKRLPLDLLYEETPAQLIKGYSNDQLRELHEKIKDLESEVVKALEYDSEVQEIIGAKLEQKKLWFYVKWEGGEKSFVPSYVLNRLSPDKVIQYYENILEFRQTTSTDENAEVSTIIYRLHREDKEKEKLAISEEIKSDETYYSKELSYLGESKIQYNSKEGLEKDSEPRKTRQGTHFNKQNESAGKTEKSEKSNEKTEKNEKSDKNAEDYEKPQENIVSAPLKTGYQTKHCSQCGVLLQYRPGLGTKAIRCPLCTTVMPIDEK